MSHYSENYYLREYEKLEEKESHKQMQWFGKRQDLVETYSWAIPNSEAIEYIASNSPIVEIGAGNGYWAWLLRDEGANVFAYDVNPPEETWTDVAQGGERRAIEHSDCALLLCWPPYGRNMAYSCLDKHICAGGQDVFYVGEGMGGCTGADDFHELLESRYELINRIDIPSYYGIHDNLYHYKLCQ